MIERRTDTAAIVAKARELLWPRVKFLPYGRTQRFGMDCIGVPMWVAAQLGIWPVFSHDGEHRLPKYSFPPQAALFDEIFPNYAAEVPEGEIDAGDIVIIKNELNHPHHVGIVVPSRIGDHLRLVGISLSRNAPFVAEFNYSPDLVARTYKVYRYRNVQA